MAATLLIAAGAEAAPGTEFRIDWSVRRIEWYIAGKADGEKYTDYRVNNPGLHPGRTHDHGHGETGFAVGESTDEKPDRVMDVSMRETMRFEFNPELKHLHDGEVIRFKLHNDGQVVHDFSIGNAAEQQAHAEMMREMPDMKHEDPSTVSLEPGASASLAWRFEGDGTGVFACNEPGHFEAGMRHDIALAHSH